MGAISPGRGVLPGGGGASLPANALTPINKRGALVMKFLSLGLIIIQDKIF